MENISYMKLTIAIPVYLSVPLHQDFTQQTLDSIVSQKHELKIIIINNFCQPNFKNYLQNLNQKTNIKVINNPQGNSVSAAWNLGLKLGKKNKSEYILTINNDLLFHSQAIDNLVKFARTHSEFILWTATEWPDLRTIKKATWDNSFSEHPHFSCFMVSPKITNIVGYFDENLQGAYFEDNDYHLRILLSGNKAAATTTAKFYHYGSRTANVDEELKIKTKRNYEYNRAYLKKKWQVDFGKQTFSPPEKILKVTYHHPFNDPAKTWHDC